MKERKNIKMDIKEFYRTINPNYDIQILLDISGTDDLEEDYDMILECIKEFPIENKNAFATVSTLIPSTQKELLTYKSAIHFLKNSANDYQFKELFEEAKSLDIVVGKLLTDYANTGKFRPSAFIFSDELISQRDRIVSLYKNLSFMISSIE